MKNRVRVATNKARIFLFNSGELQKNKEKVKKINKKDCNVVVFQSKIKR